MGAAVPFARFVIDYPALVATLCERTEQLELSRLELDRIAGLPSGYAGKVLSKQPVKTIGLNSLGPLLSSLGLVLAVLEDPAQLQQPCKHQANRPLPRDENVVAG